MCWIENLIENRIHIYLLPEGIHFSLKNKTDLNVFAKLSIYP